MEHVWQNDDVIIKHLIDVFCWLVWNEFIIISQQQQEVPQSTKGSEQQAIVLVK